MGTIPHGEPQLDELIERYLVGELTPEEEAEWEAHFFECGSCSRRLQLLQAIRDVAVSAALAQPKPEVAPRAKSIVAPFGWAWARVAAVAALVVALVPSTWLWLDNRQLKRELGSAGGSRPIATQIVLRESVRGAEVTVAHPGPGKLLLLQFSLAESADTSSVDVAIVAADSGREVWRVAGVRPIGPYGVCALTCPSELLLPGAYELRAMRGSGSAADSERFEFVIIDR